MTSHTCGLRDGLPLILWSKIVVHDRRVLAAWKLESNVSVLSPLHHTMDLHLAPTLPRDQQRIVWLYLNVLLIYTLIM